MKQQKQKESEIAKTFWLIDEHISEYWTLELECEHHFFRCNRFGFRSALPLICFFRCLTGFLPFESLKWSHVNCNSCQFENGMIYSSNGAVIKTVPSILGNDLYDKSASKTESNQKKIESNKNYIQTPFKETNA